MFPFGLEFRGVRLVLNGFDFFWERPPRVVVCFGLKLRFHRIQPANMIWAVSI